MTTTVKWVLTMAAALGWAVVGAYGVHEVVADEGGDWETPYALLTVGLMLGAALTVVAAELSSRATAHPRLRTAGLVVGGLGVVSSVVAWALPMWMLLLGLGLAMLARSTRSVTRRPLTLLAVAQLMGLASLIVAIEAEVGEPDSYGDYPAAGGIALIVTAAVTIVALVDLARTVESRAGDRGPVRDGDPVVAAAR